MTYGTDDDGRLARLGDERVHRARGGETHQQAGDGTGRLTTTQGVPVSDDQNTLRVGERGPSLLEDFHFREKIFHFDHERIPERVVHARGYGAHGYFENYQPLTDITRADVFSEAGLRTPVFVRFSTVAGNKGSGDLARDVRGFATKFYTREGNWDLVGNNIPVFFIQDAIKFPDVVHAAKDEPDRGFPQAQTAHYDAVAILAESPGARALAARPAARDFLTDAVAHSKFVGYTSGGAVLFEAAGLPMDPSSADEGFISLGEHPPAEFIARCRQLRYWHREFATAG